MATRDPNDLEMQLRDIYLKSVEEFKLKYPYLPQPFITCAYRTDEEQEILYMMNKNGHDDDGDGKIDESDEWRSSAKPGKSKHNVYPAKAFDIAFKKSNGKLDWAENLFKMFADIAKKHGATWGGDWKRKDTPHFEI